MELVVMEVVPIAKCTTEDHLILEVPAQTELLALVLLLLVVTNLATDNLPGVPGIEMQELNLFKFHINESSTLKERGLS